MIRDIKIKTSDRKIRVKTIKVFSDPGHSWVKVKRSELKELDILKDITKYSYQRGEFVYLEEDVDAGTYIKALKENNILFKFDTKRTDRSSKIRNYYHFESSENDILKYNTSELSELFEVISFSAPFVIVVRKSDGVRGSLEFTHSPRFYFNFIKD